MPPTRAHNQILETHKHDIHVQYIQEGRSREDVISYLRDVAGIEISLATLKRRLRTWGFAKQQKKLTAREWSIVEGCIANLVFNQYKSDEQIVDIMLETGIDVSKRKIGEIRRSQGPNFMRRHSAEENEARIPLLKLRMQEMLDSQEITTFGRSLLKQHMQLHGFIADE
jgi:hypothetical protein